MKNNKTLLSYILGMLSILLFIPVIEELATTILSWIEYLKLFSRKLVVKGNKELLELQGEDSEESTCTIGFQYTPDEDNYDE